MTPPPGLYSGTSTFALVARVSAFSVGLVYGNLKLKYLRIKLLSYFRCLTGYLFVGLQRFEDCLNLRTTKLNVQWAMPNHGWIMRIDQMEKLS
ncbi:hypothetical protein MANES_11G092164v8 [Manihot esculenta]|uniref:Uncharacterized protein n=1 Tax=Manihot esculenta TaxID=3983 RepID=A0ACB7GUD8_MANES|nr:hypothetical protein MANES_11G092164v8 [Manihot esculenta]